MELMRPMKLGGEQLVFGENALSHLERLKGTRALVIMNGQRFCYDGVFDRVKGYLQQAGMEVDTFDDVPSDPGFACVRAGAQKMQQWQPDVIVALGGGSAMDAAKAMWVLYEHPEIETFAQFAACHNRMPRLRQRAYLVALPTTSGTASEVSRSTVITDDETGRKMGVSDMQLVPDVAVLEPELTFSMPASLTAETGMDALTHAVESFVSLRANQLSDVFALQAAQMILNNLVSAYQNPQDYQARNAMQLGSCLAGMAFSNVSLGICHSIAHTLGGEFHLGHGLLNAIALPYVITYNQAEPGAADKFKQMAKGVGVKDLAQTVREMNGMLAIPPLNTLVEKERFFAKLPELARMALADGCTKTNPRPVDEQAMEHLLKEIYGGCA